MTSVENSQTEQIDQMTYENVPTNQYLPSQNNRGSSFFGFF